MNRSWFDEGVRAVGGRATLGFASLGCPGLFGWPSFALTIVANVNRDSRKLFWRGATGISLVVLLFDLFFMDLVLSDSSFWTVRSSVSCSSRKWNQSTRLRLFPTALCTAGYRTYQQVAQVRRCLKRWSLGRPGMT